MNNFFFKGDFKIQESWEQQKPPARTNNSRDKSRDKEKNSSLVNAGKNIIEPSTDLIDDELSKRILKEFAAEIPPASIKSDKKLPKENDFNKKLPPKQKILSNDGDLLASMAARLKTVEMTSKNQKEELKEKSDLIEKLKTQNAFLKSFREDSSKEYEKMENLKLDNESLKKKAQQMEAYLKKYGLKWVGTKIEGKLEHEKLKKDINKGNFQYRLPSEIDIGTVMRRVEQLNGGLQAEGQGTEIYQENGVHKFRKAEPLPLGFFSNGIAIKGYKFYPYKSKESLHILSDLVDGYFPYVLKAKYPNGVFLKVVDKVAQKYTNQSSSEIINTFQSNESNDFKPPSKEEFLNKLPKQVMMNGKVINIRGEIEKRLNGQKEEIKEQLEDEDNEFYLKEDGVSIFKTECWKKMQLKVVGQEQICTLKIRNEEGEVLIMHLEKEKHVKDIEVWLRRLVKNSFKLMSNFPRRSYESSEESNLQELGFFPNAMLHIQSNK